MLGRSGGSCAGPAGTSRVSWLGSTIHHASPEEQREVADLYIIMHRPADGPMVGGRRVVAETLTPRLSWPDGTLRDLPQRNAEHICALLKRTNTEQKVKAPFDAERDAAASYNKDGFSQFTLESVLQGILAGPKKPNKKQEEIMCAMTEEPAILHAP